MQAQSKKQQSLKDKLKERKERRRHKTADLSGLSDEEKEELLAADEAEAEADKAFTDAVIMSAVMDIDNEAKRELMSNFVREKTEISEDEKQEMVDKFIAEAHEIEEKHRNQHEYHNAVVQAKLAAKKRMREEKLREEALKKELNALSAKQVFIQSFI